MPLEMKYFVLKPHAKSKDDKYAFASQQAMMKYGLTIRETDEQFAQELMKWAREEHAIQMTFDAE